MRGDNVLANAAVSYFKLSSHGCLLLGVNMGDNAQLCHGAVPPSGFTCLRTPLQPEVMGR